MGLGVVVALPAPRRRPGWSRAVSRFRRRIAADVHVWLALGLVAPVLAINVLADRTNLAAVLALCGAFLGIQAGIPALSRRVTNRSGSVPRLLLALLFVALANKLTGAAGVQSIAMLFIPIVALAATIGGREAVIFGVTACVLYAFPALSGDTVAFERAILLAATGILLAVGTRRTVVSLERVLGHLQDSRKMDRRRAGQIAGVEAVGRLLAEDGASPEALEKVMDLLVHRFGYRYVSIYLGDSRAVRLGAQRGYPNPILEIESGRGVVGRVMRTGQAAFVQDAAKDEDYVGAADEIASEVSVPLIMRGEPFGVLNVEGTRDQPVDAADLATMTLIGDRLAAALALARERDALTLRATLFERLTAFAGLMTATLAPDELYHLLAESVTSVIPCDAVTLTVLDTQSNVYRIAAAPGTDAGLIGLRINPGEGLTGRAIAERRLIVDDRHERSSWPPSLRHAHIPDALLIAAVPLIRETTVVGAIAVMRYDLDNPFDALELEALPLLASQAALAITNAKLHADTMEASVRDPLTGLFNRRHLDASIERLFAARDRLSRADQRPVSVILFDLDHFGSFNKEHGHQVGDEVLRTFARILRSRFRASDIVARFGGEEFLVALDGADRDEAVRLADEVRLAFGAESILGPDGSTLKATVSAGCAGVSAGKTTAAALLGLADVGLAMAKHAGRNQVVAA